GLYFGDGTKLQRLVAQLNNNFLVQDRYSAWNTFVIAPFQQSASLWSPIRWFRLRDSGTSKFYSVSPDRLNWLQVYTASSTEYLASTTRVGVCLNGNTGGNNTGRVCGLALESWQVS